MLAQILPLGRSEFSGRSLSEVLQGLPAEAKDRALIQEICFGVCRWYTRLDKLIAPLIRKPLKAKDADIQALILIGVYQLYYLRIPDHAAIAETVEACRQLSKPWAVGLVNGLLRNCQRQKAELEQQLPSSQAITQAHPQWLLDQLQLAWPEALNKLLTANNQAAPLCLRVNQNVHSREQIQRQLKQAGIDCHPGTLSTSALYLAQPRAVESIPTFASGGLSVQDEAAQLSAFLLDPQPGERILDACAAPGGKTCHLLEMQPKLEQLIALDQDEVRLQRVQQNLDRLQLSAQCVASSLQAYAATQPEPFDRILLDAPCSATGVIRRHPDIKWLRKKADIKRISALQAELINLAFSLLKPGGTLLYATCSVLPQENERIVEGLLRDNTAAEIWPIEGLPNAGARTGCQLLPSADGWDGFYYGRLRRKHSLC